MPQALDFRKWIGGEAKIFHYCNNLALEGGRRMAKIFGTQVMDPNGELTLNMVNVPHLNTTICVLSSLYRSMLSFHSLQVSPGTLRSIRCSRKRCSRKGTRTRPTFFTTVAGGQGVVHKYTIRYDQYFHAIISLRGYIVLSPLDRRFRRSRKGLDRSLWWSKGKGREVDKWTDGWLISCFDLEEQAITYFEQLSSVFV